MATTQNTSHNRYVNGDDSKYKMIHGISGVR